MQDTPTPPETMTYRVGTYVIDTRSATLAQVMGTLGPHVQVRRPGGGREGEVPPHALRLATREERVAYRCKECARLLAAQRKAVDGGSREQAVAATVAVRNHVRRAHPTGNPS
ncbi:hypothetical protein [Streptomyces griseocarneus]|uniref:hypothetical protein n=1 Tax=Streptomyces griseocarneus TaxID=51201 RepID=UPI00167E6983|nr:hypothetical protein [Streptomyces griseocarneus]MBZ6473746.1 hypothetical protein [Streptomyces griseocarneus]GHG64874.1 hypothetical protein GCM10018779_35150 [Streptomyces griseocarneus]